MVLRFRDLGLKQNDCLFESQQEDNFFTILVYMPLDHAKIFNASKLAYFWLSLGGMVANR